MYEMIRSVLVKIQIPSSLITMLNLWTAQVQSQCHGTVQANGHGDFITSSRWREREREQIFTGSPSPAAPDTLLIFFPKQMDSRFIKNGFGGRIPGSVYLERQTRSSHFR